MEKYKIQMDMVKSGYALPIDERGYDPFEDLKAHNKRVKVRFPLLDHPPCPTHFELHIFLRASPVCEARKALIFRPRKARDISSHVKKYKISEESRKNV